MSYLMDTVTRDSRMKVEDAMGCYLETISGTYMDWFMDCGVTSLGYRPTKLLYQIANLAFPHLPNTVVYGPREQVAYELCDLTGLSEAFFCNSGTEAVEAAIKIVRKWNHNQGTGRNTIWTAKGGFHGRTLGSLSAGDSAKYHTTGFWPLVGGFQHFDADQPEYIDWDTAAGILLEPIAGNNDVREREQLGEICLHAMRRNIPIVFDEIQSGAFRTGEFTAAKLYGIEPDIICLGKRTRQKNS